jgi:hypothetical protein
LNKLLFLLASLISLTASSQHVKVINKAEIKNLPEGKKYAFIEPTTDTSQIQFVATIIGKDKNRKKNIESLYFEIRKAANKLGANCYKLRTFARDTLNHETVLILDSYYASEDILNQNTANHEYNVVFIFGEEREDEKTISFDLNGVSKEIKAGTYYKITLKEGEEIKVKKGGLIGDALSLSWEKDKQPSFYTLSGFGLSNFNMPPSYGNQMPVLGVGFKTGSINKIGNISLGLLLTQLLKQGE